MCDTLFASAKFTGKGVGIFAKNSDRDPNEAHVLIEVPAADHGAEDLVKCTYVSIPQVSHTYALLLAKPFWIWGAEMGANEHGLVIGNEAVFSKVKAGKTPGLIGMDYLRLALERAVTAREALNVITDLLAVYGQSGNCGFQHPFFYHNSFLIADPEDAWVLETAGQHWVAKQVPESYAISNCYSIGKDWDLASEDVIQYAILQGWCLDSQDFHFARAYSDTLITHFAYGRERSRRTNSLLEQKRGNLTAADAMDILRDHGENVDRNWDPGQGVTGASVCMHAGFGPVRISQTTGSMVSCLGSGQTLHYFTGTAAPCTSLFKPVWMDAGMPDNGPVPTGVYDRESSWWQHELLHRTILLNYPELMEKFTQERNRYEQKVFLEGQALEGKTALERKAFSERCFLEARLWESNFLEKVQVEGFDLKCPWYTRNAWDAHSHTAQLPNIQPRKSKS